MFESSQIQLSKKALQHNLQFIKKLLHPGVRFCSVVKGNAYGHGLVEFVRIAMAEGVDYFGVHAAEEAFTIKQHISPAPDIFIMGNVDDEAVSWAVNEEVEFAVFDLQRLEVALHVATLFGKPAKIHIELETGMHRTGFPLEQLTALAGILKLHTGKFILQGLFTHFAGAESVINHYRVMEQEKIYREALSFFEARELFPVYKHMACSAALLNYPHTQSNMVRIGILQYGFWPNQESHTRFIDAHHIDRDNLLLRVISWQTKVMAIAKVEKGKFIGYGTSFVADQHMTLATIPVGYSHGYSRSLSNIGFVLINGKKANVIGTINMNSLTVDVTHCGTVAKGDEVILIGKQKNRAITVNSFSEQSQLLNYEMLTRLPADIPRKVIK